MNDTVDQKKIETSRLQSEESINAWNMDSLCVDDSSHIFTAGVYRDH
jgi:hypothetical protein